MKKTILIFSLLLMFIFGIAFLSGEAQSDAEPQDLFKQFPVLKYREYFYQNIQKEYYRFPTLVPIFDPLDLGYFPHETWTGSNWSLLERWQDTWTYHQLIMLDQPAKTWTFQGTGVGKDWGFLDDFYLYATLFVTDNHPEGSGSCYVYYSDSLLKGFGSSTGILVDPGSGIFKVDNSYGGTYNLTNKKHEMNIIKTLSPAKFPLDEENIEASSFGAQYFPHESMDEHFTKDLKAVRSESHIPGSEIRAYRLELIREGTKLRVYINGRLAANIDDGIVKTDPEGNSRPEMVSWSFGPLLRTEGETVTCAVGDFYVYGTQKAKGEE